MADKLLELRGISKSFGGLQVISALDLHVDEGEIVSVIGPNGAGKTTLFNLVTRRTRATCSSPARRSSGSSRTRSRRAASRARSRRCACS
jgi:branched-chain amino acid transport system ATP-binding protein